LKSRLFAALPLLAAVAIPALPAIAAPAAEATPRPKLVVMISVDQFSADIFAEYRGRYTQGFKRLADGAVFPSGYQSHGATETCPGHSTLLTGSRPARTGIIANNWFDLSLPRPDKRVYCAEDPAEPGSSSEDYVPATQYLKVPTLGDRMKRANPADRVVSVAGKDRAAIMRGGHATDQIWFWGGKGFVTLKDHAATPVPAAIAPANSAANALIARDEKQALPTVCAAKSVAVPVGNRTVGTLDVRKAGSERGFRASPSFDAAIGGLAIALIDEMKLGRGQGTDLLTIGLSATDYVGHGFGTEGAEMCAQQIALDATIGRILTALDKTGVPYAVALSADHGGHDLPERNQQHGFDDAHRIPNGESASAIGEALAKEFGLKGATLFADGPAGDIYLARDIPAAIRPQVLASARARFLADPDVEAMFTADELRRVRPSGLPIEEWPLAERFAASFDPERSGDLVVALKARVTPIAKPTGTVATHGSPWNYDRRVPILFWWPGMRGFEQPNGIETVDIMPTLAALIHVPAPREEIDGRCLDLDATAATTCGSVMR